MPSIIEEIATLKIGTVDSVSVNEIKVVLDNEAPFGTALNSGIPQSFPRINNYLLLPNEQGAIIGIITWIGIEKTTLPSKSGNKHNEIIDLPYPLRKLCLTPIGTLHIEHDDNLGNNTKLNVKRGIEVFPTVGDQVLLPPPKFIKAIIENTEKNNCIFIGESPLIADAKVRVNPDKLFGRHLAVLGNTGSGKSCTVAGLVRWSLDAAKKEIGNKPKKLNSRFIILDPNGEYSKAFSSEDDEKLSNIKKFAVKLENCDDNQFEQLKVPAWMWNSSEWASITRAQSQSQLPTLTEALRNIKSSNHSSNNYLNTFFTNAANSIESVIQNLPNSVTEYRLNQELIRLFNSILANSSSEAIRIHLNEFTTHTNKQAWISNLSLDWLIELKDKLQNEVDITHKSIYRTNLNEDTPCKFDMNILPANIKNIAIKQNSLSHVQYLIHRINTLFSDLRMKSVIDPEEDIDLLTWLNDYIGKDEDDGSLSIIDLSLVPNDVLHLVVSVISRIIFEAIQRYRKLNNKSLPTVLIMEEAHNFISKSVNNDDYISPAIMCRQTFEKIAREGRKFGLGLVLSSQRPSELSPTVLSQCNTFILHRIVNDRDQELVNKLVPDNLSGLLNELPSLPSQQAIILGWATPIPILMNVRTLSKIHQPASSDPDFWEVWTGADERKIDWEKIIADWTGNNESNDTINDSPITNEISENAKDFEPSNSEFDDDVPF